MTSFSLGVSAGLQCPWFCSLGTNQCFGSILTNHKMYLFIHFLLKKLVQFPQKMKNCLLEAWAKQAHTRKRVMICFRSIVYTMMHFGRHASTGHVWNNGCHNWPVQIINLLLSSNQSNSPLANTGYIPVLNESPSFTVAQRVAPGWWCLSYTSSQEPPAQNNFLRMFSNQWRQD